MEKLKYIYLALIGLALTLSACSDGSEINKTLEVEEAKVILTYTAQNKSVPFTASKGEAIVATWKGNEWDEPWGSVVVDQATGKVVISVKENPSVTLRRATVLVSLASGWGNRVIEVVQNGSSSSSALVVVPDRLVFDYMGCEQIVKIETDVEGWSVSKDLDWVHVSIFPFSKEMIISLDENTEFTARSTSITITAGAASKEVLLEQVGFPYYLLPYIDYNADPSSAAMRKFEIARHNTPLNSNLFTTSSTFFPLIEYEINRRGDVQAALMYVSAANVQELANVFPQYLIENGFEYLEAKEDGTYYWLDNGLEEGTVHCMARFLYGSVYFYPTDRPVSHAPTFEEFPYPTTELTWGVNAPAIRTWEAANGGVFNEELEYAMNFNVPASDDIYFRIYEFTQPNLVEMYALGAIYYDVYKFYSKNGPIFWQVNANLYALLIREGFTPVDIGSTIVYKHATEDLVAMIMAYQSIEAGETDPPEFAGFTFYSRSELDPITPVGPSQSELAERIKRATPPAPKGLRYVDLNADRK